MMFVQGALAGTLFGAGVVGHALRIATLADEEGVELRYGIARAAMVLYFLAALGAAGGVPLGAWIAIVGPVLGVTAVLVTGNKVDTFQLVLGAGQGVSLLLGVVWLWLYYASATV